MRQQRN